MFVIKSKLIDRCVCKSFVKLLGLKSKFQLNLKHFFLMIIHYFISNFPQGLKNHNEFFGFIEASCKGKQKYKIKMLKQLLM